MPSSVLIATLATSFYDDPSLLWNAPASIAVQQHWDCGHTFVVTPAVGFKGNFTVKLTLSDGTTSVLKTFNVRVI